MTIFELLPWFIAISVTVLSAAFFANKLGLPDLWAWLIALTLGAICWISYWLLLKGFYSRFHQRAGEKERRTYQDFDATKNYTVSKNFYYECLICGNVVTSMPKKNETCKCKNITIGANGSRIEIRDNAKIKIFSLTAL